MARPLLACLPGLCLLLAAGCCFQRAQVVHPEPPAPDTPAVARSNMESVLLKQAAELSEQPPPSCVRPLANSYHLVPMKMTQCLAARHAPVAAMLDQERAALAEKNERTCDLLHRHDDEQRELQMLILYHAALEVRNTTAGAALEGYLGLAGADVRAELLQSGLGEVGAAIKKTKDLRAQGLKPPVELDALLKQQIDGQLDEVQNQMLIYRLNVELLKATKLDDGWRIWPEPACPPPADACPDPAEAISVGLANRPKLVMLRETIPRINRHTVESARLILQNVNALLGSSSSSPAPLPVLTKMIAVIPEARAADQVRDELQAYLRDEEKSVAAEVRQALTELAARRQVVVLARTRLKYVEDRLKDLKQLQAQGLAGYAEEFAVHADWYKSRGEVVKELLLWRAADVKLRLAQGLLVAECGYGSHPCQE